MRTGDFAPNSVRNLTSDARASTYQRATRKPLELFLARCYQKSMRYLAAFSLSLLVATSASSFASANDEVVLLADKPGAKLRLIPVDKGQPKVVDDGTKAQRASVDGLEPIGAWSQQGIAIDGVKYQLPGANVCTLHGSARKDSKAVYTCDYHEGVVDDIEGFNRLWYAPRLGKRIKIATKSPELTVALTDVEKALDVIIDGNIMYILDPATGKITKVKNAGAPSWNTNGVLFYRTLNGNAWKFERGKSTKLGKGQPGKAFKWLGNHGEYDASVWPGAVTFDQNNEPTWK